MAALLLIVLTGCEAYVPELALANCTSDYVDDDGLEVLTAYDFKGWPVEIQTRTGPEADPVVTTIEYVRVAGGVVESLAVTGDYAVSSFYDPNEVLEQVVPNDPDAETIDCTISYDKRGDLESTVCSTGVTTTYDACANPVDITTEDGRVESIGYTYDGCKVLGRIMLGLDEVGPYGENTQYLLGRPISSVFERDGALFSSYTSWDCPAVDE